LPDLKNGIFFAIYKKQQNKKYRFYIKEFNFDKMFLDSKT